MASSPTKAQVERLTGKRIRPYLKQYATQIRRADRVIYEALVAAPEVHPEPDAVRAQVILLARISNDLSAALALAQRGYVLQSWTLSSSLLEHVFCLGYIGHDDRRAEEWFNHSAWESTPWRIKRMIKGLVQYLDLGEELEARYAERYKQLCVAKHGNPVVLKYFGVNVSKDVTRISMDPAFSIAKARLTRVGLSYALSATSLALWAFLKDRGFPNRVERSVMSFAAESVELEQNSLTT
jgi:hypothetical protein